MWTILELVEFQHGWSCVKTFIFLEIFLFVSNLHRFPLQHFVYTNLPYDYYLLNSAYGLEVYM